MSQKNIGMVETSLCGCSLRDGSIAIGVWGVISNLISSGVGMYLGITEHHSALVIGGWAIAGMGLVMACLSTFLIFAVFVRRAKLIMFYVNAMPVLLVFTVTSSIIISAAAQTFTLITIAGILACMAMWCYFLVIVGSYASSIEDEPLIRRIADITLPSAESVSDTNRGSEGIV